MAADVSTYLDEALRAGARYDLVLIDPPSFSAARHAPFAIDRDYPPIIRAACDLLAPGGDLWLAANTRGYSLTGAVQVAVPAARQPRLVALGGLPPDYPTELADVGRALPADVSAAPALDTQRRRIAATFSSSSRCIRSVSRRNSSCSCARPSTSTALARLALCMISAWARRAAYICRTSVISAFCAVVERGLDAPGVDILLLQPGHGQFDGTLRGVVVGHPSILLPGAGGKGGEVEG